MGLFWPLPPLCKHILCTENKQQVNFFTPSPLSSAYVVYEWSLSYDKELAPASLAEVYLELMMQKECYLRALRALLREIVRYLRYDINLHSFCLHLMQLSVSCSHVFFYYFFLTCSCKVSSCCGFFLVHVHFSQGRS